MSEVRMDRGVSSSSFSLNNFTLSSGGMDSYSAMDLALNDVLFSACLKIYSSVPSSVI